MMKINETMDELTSLVSSMRIKTTKQSPYELIKHNSLIGSFIKAKAYLNSQSYGKVLESRIMNEFEMIPAITETEGDARSKNGSRVEIKVSLGSKKDNMMNYVQIRMNHDIDYFLFASYDLINDLPHGKLVLFLIPYCDMEKLSIEYGTYAHGTLKINGPIKKGNIRGKKYEYCLRPCPTAKKDTKPRKIWDRLISDYALSEEEVSEKLSSLKSS